MLKILTKSVDFFKCKIYNEVVKKINKKWNRGEVQMKVNVEAVKQLIKERFRDNTSWFAEEIGMKATYVSTILNNPEKYSSDRLCNCIIKYCELNSLNFRDYIFLQ